MQLHTLVAMQHRCHPPYSTWTSGNEFIHSFCSLSYNRSTATRAHFETFYIFLIWNVQVPAPYKRMLQCGIFYLLAMTNPVQMLGHWTQLYSKHARRGLKIFVGLGGNMQYPPGNVASCMRKVLTRHHIPEEWSSQPRYHGNIKTYVEEATRGMRNLHNAQLCDWYSLSKLI